VLPSLSRVSKRLTRHLSHSLLPGSCSLCLSSLQASSGVLCQHCIAELPRLTNHCQRCSATLESNLICGSCQRRPPIFGRCISAFHYHSPIDSIILRLKNDPYTANIKPLSAVLAERIASTYRHAQLPCPETIIPLPLHWLKMAKRGFNQSYIISGLVADHLRRDHGIAVEIRSDICQRRVMGQDQHLLSAKQRLSSIKNAFAVEPSADRKLLANREPSADREPSAHREPSAYKETSAAQPLIGRSVAVVDDVVTTGATANSIASALLRAGAAQVDIWSIARTSWNNSTG
jgi:predicted amidophosphoribosyltransferase